MRHRRLAQAAAALAVVLALSAAGAIAASGSHSRQTHRGLALSGHVAGLLPGDHRRLTIHVKNRLRRPVHLRSITTTVHAPVPKCSGANLVVARYRGTRLIRPGGSVQVTVPVSMRRDSPAACQGRVFRLTFRGQASA